MIRNYEKYKDSGVEWIGEMPEGWEVKKIKHRCYVKGRVGWNGLKSSEFMTKGYAYLITGTDFKKDVIDWNNCYHIDQTRYEEDPFIQLQNEDLLITKDGTIGKLAVVSDLDKPACLNSGILLDSTIILHMAQPSSIYIKMYL
jgi:type I restriction enzyme S subunit